ncbi:MAG: tetratricopeptide repeat protein, partial [Steroidobacteraceae bacterium]|nr:tetratricopeptide repeat protein [Steroidobacteraceae bacterium]
MAGVALPFRAAGGLIALALLGAAAAPPAAADDAARLQIYRDFRVAFDARRYPEALPLAEQLVALTEQQLGAEDKALVNPLTNLGTVHYRMGNYPAAEAAYQRAVAIAEATANGPASVAMIRPLHGLGEVLLATGRADVAAIMLDRAIDLTRSLNGLYHESQLAILPSLIDSYVALGRLADAEKEHQYGFRVAEH